jgi:dTDP-4-amino-4,6-dideoxygalactose transaminase
MVTTNNEVYAKKLGQLRVHGETSRYVHDLIGTNSRLDALQAAVLRIKLQHLDDWVEKRQAHAKAYHEQLTQAGLQQQLSLPQPSAHCTRHVWNQFTLRVLDGAEKRDALREYLTERSIGAGVYYPIPMHQQKCFANLDAIVLPVTERICQEVLSLPMYPELGDDQRDHVVQSIIGFFGQS